MRHLALMVVYLCVLVVPARFLGAQTLADTTPASFHQGEWGVGFIIRNSVTDGGVLRFSTPTRAWVLDGSASFDRESLSGNGVNTDQTAQTTNVGAQFGPRWYHAMSGHATRYLGLGMSGAYARSELSGTGGHANFWSVGGYGEIGMQYMVTRYLALGARGTLSASRGEMNSTEISAQGFANTLQSTSYRVVLDAVQLTGTIYF